jgi:hypothetical protein
MKLPLPSPNSSGIRVTAAQVWGALATAQGQFEPPKRTTDR